MNQNDITCVVDVSRYFVKTNSKCKQSYQRTLQNNQQFFGRFLTPFLETLKEPPKELMAASSNNVKNLNGAGIQTHNLQNMSLLP